MNLKLQKLGPIAPGGTVFHVAGREDSLWLASPAGLFHLHAVDLPPLPLSASPLEGGTEGGRAGQAPTWQAISRGLPFWRINAILAAGNSLWVAGMPGGLVRAPNRLQSRPAPASPAWGAWRQCWIDQVEAPIISLAASPNYSQDRVLLAGTGGEGILRSTDGGRYWELSNFGLRDFSIFNLAVAPAWDRYEYAFAVTENNIYQSPNGGRAWRRAELEREVQPAAIAASPNFAADRTIFVGCATGELLLSTDAGRSYRLAATGFEAIEALAFTPQGSLLLGTPDGVCRFEAAKLPPCNEEGRRGSKLPSPVIGLSVIGDKLYAGLVGGLASSSDDGQSWQMAPGLSARRFLWLLTPDSALWLAAGPEEGLWSSRDQGQSWQQIWAETPLLALTAESSPSEGRAEEGSTQIWLSSQAGIATSTDSGLTWAASPPPSTGSGGDETLITALAVKKGTLWAGSHDSRLWRRSPSGDWSTLKTPFAGSQMLGIFVLSPPLEGGLGGVEAVLVAVWQAERVDLWRTEDEGITWSKWFSAASRAITPQLIFTGKETLVGLGSDIHRLLPEGRWQRYRLTTLEAPVTALLPLADQALAALTDRLVASTPTGDWGPVETGIDGQPIAAMAQSGERLVILTSDGHVFVKSNE